MQHYIIEKQEDMCPKCGENPAAEEHTSPFQTGVNNDYEFLCTCCKDCVQECNEELS